MSQLQIGRLILGPAIEWHEQLGDPVTNLGGAVIPAPRQAIRHMVAIATYAADGATDTVAARFALRRQLRSMFNNTPLKLQGFFYVQYSDDPEQNGWYIPDFGTLNDIEASAGLATGVWKLENVAWLMVGHRRTNREARNIWMKDMRSGLPWRDYLKYVFSTDFSALPALSLSALPSGASSVSNAVAGNAVPTVALPRGRDGGICQLAAGPAQPPTSVAQLANPINADLANLAFERSESAYGLTDVIAYDRRANFGPFGAGTGTNLCDNPSFETDTNNWSTARGTMINAGAVLSRITTDHSPVGSLVGIACAQVVCNGAAADEGINDQPTLSGGTTYTLSVWLKSVSGTTALAINIGGNTGTSQNITINTSWNQYTVTGLGVQNAINIFQPGSAAATFLVDTITLTAGATAPNYFDGNTTGWLWSGTTNDSTSVPNTALYDTAAGITNPQTAYGWEEVYGPDYQWSWLAGLTAADAPTLENGLVRIRYDTGQNGAGLGAGKPGFRVDVWTGSTYVEQGKMIVERIGNFTSYCDTWVAASLVEATPDKATILVVLASSGDVNSREKVYITLQRGEIGATFECYPALKADALTPADVALQWTPALNAGAADLNNSVAKIDSQGTGNWTPGAAGTGKYAATAGTGAGTGNSGQFGGLATLGNANFTSSENWAAVLRYPTAFNVVGAYQQTLVVLQAANAQVKTAGDTNAYGSVQDTYQVLSQNAAGYLQCQIQFSPTQAQQVLEAESMTLGTGTATAADAGASGTGSNTTTATRTTDANPHVSQAAWPNAFFATYRVFARVKTSASTLNVYAKTGATTGSTVTTTSGIYVWVDLGEIVANNTTLEIHCWATAAATVSVDRIEAVLVQDRTRTSAIYSGARDAGQAALFDTHTFGAIVSR